VDRGGGLSDIGEIENDASWFEEGDAFLEATFDSCLKY